MWPHWIPTRGSTVASKKIREPSMQAAGAFERADGTFTANPHEMHGIVDQFWVNGIFQR